MKKKILYITLALILNVCVSLSVVTLAGNSQAKKVKNLTKQCELLEKELSIAKNQISDIYDEMYARDTADILSEIDEIALEKDN